MTNNRKLLATGVGLLTAGILLTGCTSGSLPKVTSTTNSQGSSSTSAPASKVPASKTPGGSVASSTPDEATINSIFLQYIHGRIPNVNVQNTDSGLVTLGHAVCADWNSGDSFNQVLADGITAFPDWSTTSIAVFIGAATGAYCPQYSTKFDN